MEERSCFICSNRTVLYLRNVSTLKSKHSETPVPEFLRKICGDDDFIAPGEEDATSGQSIICMECVRKIDDYDAACIMKERIEREFRVTLQRSKELQGNVEMIEVKIESIANIADMSNDCEYPSDLEGIEMKTDELHQSTTSSDCDEDENSGDDRTFKCETFTPKLRSQNGLEERNIGRISLKRRATGDSAEKKHRFLKKSPENKIIAKRKTEPFKCPICGIVAEDGELLREHKALHEGKPALQCITCNQFFKSKGTLVRHTLIHVGNRTFQCERCGNSFMHYSSLQMHIKAHGDIREKQCPHCPNQFRSTSHLNRHIRIHTGDKPYACPKCQQRFAQRYNMTVHLRLHDSTEKSKAVLKHVCTICESAFARPSKLAEHYCRAHETMMPQANGNDAIVQEASSD